MIEICRCYFDVSSEGTFQTLGLGSYSFANWRFLRVSEFIELIPVDTLEFRRKLTKLF